MKEIALTLPVPVLLNRLYRVSGKRIYKSTVANQYKQACWLIGKEAKVKVTDEWVELDIFWYRARRSGDIDSVLKLLLDALEDVLYGNDSQVQKLTITKRHDKENPRIELTMRPFNKK